jgi:hypothetical protein
MEGGKITMAHSLATMMRGLINYGATVLEDSECERLSVVLHNFRFEVPKPSNVVRISPEQVVAIRTEARKSGAYSIALAQAIQYELGLRQRDVIGEWIPEDEPGDSDIRDGKGMKWVRGIRWDEVKDLVLRHPTSRSGATVTRSLSKSKTPMVMEELEQLGWKVPLAGPIIVSEATGLPYVAWEFRRMWRLLARRAGIPNNVKNMDSRPKVKRSAEAANMNDHTDEQSGWTSDPAKFPWENIRDAAE